MVLLLASLAEQTIGSLILGGRMVGDGILACAALHSADHGVQTRPYSHSL
jgi:hypothetical protein